MLRLRGTEAKGCISLWVLMTFVSLMLSCGPSPPIPLVVPHRMERPPDALLEIDGQWQKAEGDITEWRSGNHYVIVDGSGMITRKKPLVVHSPFTAVLTIPLPPSRFSLTVIPTIPGVDAQLRSLKPGRTIALKPKRRQRIPLSLEPGVYVLGVFAGWEEHRRATYSFLIEVQE